MTIEAIETVKQEGDILYKIDRSNGIVNLIKIGKIKDKEHKKDKWELQRVQRDVDQKLFFTLAFNMLLDVNSGKEIICIRKNKNLKVLGILNE